MAHNVRNIYHLDLYRKSLPPVLEQSTAAVTFLFSAIILDIELTSFLPP